MATNCPATVDLLFGRSVMGCLTCTAILAQPEVPWPTVDAFHDKDGATTLVTTPKPWTAAASLGAPPDCGTVVLMRANHPNDLKEPLTFLKLAKVRGRVTLAVLSRAAALFAMAVDTRPFFFDVAFLQEGANGTFRRATPTKRKSVSVPPKVRAAYTYLEPWVNYPSKGVEDLAGVDVDIWKIVSRHLGVQVDFVQGGTFLGIIKMVANGSADVAITEPTFAHARYEVADISAAAYVRTIGFASRRPVPVPSGQTLISPLTPAAWASVLVILLVVLAALVLINAVRSRLHRPTNSRFHLISLSIIPLISESLPHRWFDVRNGWAGRIILFIWLPMAAILSAAYESNLLPGLVKISYEKPVSTYGDILDRQLPFYSRANSIITPLMKYSPRKVVRQVYRENLEGRGGFFDPEGLEGLPGYVFRLVMAGEAVSVAVDEAMPAYDHLLTMSKKDHLLKAYTGFYYAVNHPLRDRFDDALLRLQAAGVTPKLFAEQEWRMRRAGRDYMRSGRGDAGRKREAPITVGHVFPMFALLVAGVVLGTCAFAGEAGEAATTRWRKRRAKRKEAVWTPVINIHNF